MSPQQGIQRNTKEIIVLKIILLQKWKGTRINIAGDAGRNNFHANENCSNGQASDLEIRWAKKV